MNSDDFKPDGGFEQAVTTGDYATEKASAEAFDGLVERTGLFKVFSEVPGHVAHPQWGCESGTLRIDRVLIPTTKMLEAGWTRGAIGVEIKKSGIKAGRPLSQLLDYGRCTWRLPSGITVVCRYNVLWPLDRQHGIVASIMQQNRVGCAWLGDENYGPSLYFFCGEANLFIYNLDSGRLILGTAKIGERTGSR